MISLMLLPIHPRRPSEVNTLNQVPILLRAKTITSSSLLKNPTISYVVPGPWRRYAVLNKIRAFIGDTGWLVNDGVGEIMVGVCSTTVGVEVASSVGIPPGLEVGCGVTVATSVICARTKSDNLGLVGEGVGKTLSSGEALLKRLTVIVNSKSKIAGLSHFENVDMVSLCDQRLHFAI